VESLDRHALVRVVNTDLTKKRREIMNERVTNECLGKNEIGRLNERWLVNKIIKRIAKPLQASLSAILTKVEKAIWINKRK
jgi:hypothetical protein